MPCLRWLLPCCLILVGLTVAACFRASPERYLVRHEDALHQPLRPHAPYQEFTVERGQSAQTIAQALADHNLIADPDLFEAYVQVMALDTRLKAGVYQLSAGMTIPDLARELQQDRPLHTRVTLPEGLRLEELARRQEDHGLGRETRFLALVQDPEMITLWAQRFPFLDTNPPLQSLEGFLFPDTYFVPDEGDQAHSLVRAQLEQFQAQVLPRYREARTQGAVSFTLYEVLILASLIERETYQQAEMPRIAGVLINRLAQNMHLQIDATLQYALGYDAGTQTWWRTQLTTADFQTPSRYNTYREPGLPPGPIANPGLAAIQAILYPETHDYLYFVVNPDRSGTHLFATTYEQHLDNIALWQEVAQE